MLSTSASSQARPSVAPAVLPEQSCCKHCGNPLLDRSADDFCCNGCRTIYGLLTGAGLSRYYELRDGAIMPPTSLGELSRRDRNWLEPLSARVAAASEPIEVSIKLQGLRCVACVWLIQELFARYSGAHRIIISTGRSSMNLCVDASFPLAGFISELETFGYIAGDDSHTAAQSGDLLLRTGVCLALGMNAMMFAAAIYLGLHDGPLYRVLHGLNFACATLAVLIGAPVFMRSAWHALQQRILHLDLPIAVGIALTYSAALWSFATNHPGAAYYDSLAIFIALMLLGRWLKERVVSGNQKQLQADDGIEQLLVRRIEGGVVQLRAAGEVKAGDELLVPPGDLIPVASELLSGGAACSLDWISGESDATVFGRGAVVPAGAFNAESCALRVRARDDFGASVLVELLGRRRAREMPATDRGNKFVIAYVAGVLLTAASAFVGWWLFSGSVTRALEVATAICVVTCPCAIGIAAPLAEDLVLSGLRRSGLFVRSASFLDRALSVRRVVFDKTGTLTTGRLHIANAAALQQLGVVERNVLYTLACGSVHPKSIAVARALQALDAKLVDALGTTELTGLGVQCHSPQGLYRLGRADWALGENAQSSDSSDLVFAFEGKPACVLHTAETPRVDAAQEIAALREAGYELWMLSGDAPERVKQMARTLGVEASHALGGCSPQDKAQWIVRHDHNDLLMIGDGVNDSLAVERAFVSGTPAIDRAFMPWRSDFYFVTSGLAPIRLALRASRRLAQVVRRNQAFAIAYNVCVVTLAVCGLMRPWLAAVLMPASSIIVLTATSLSLSTRSRLWKS